MHFKLLQFLNNIDALYDKFYIFFLQILDN